MATKLRRMVTYFEGLLPIKSHDSLIKFSDKIMWHTKTITSTLPQWCPGPLYLVEWWLTMKGFHPLSDITLWSGGLERSRDKLKPLHFHCHNVYRRQEREVTWQFEKLLFPLSHELWPLNLSGCWYQGRASACKHLYRHWLLAWFQNGFLQVKPN